MSQQLFSTPASPAAISFIVELLACALFTALAHRGSNLSVPDSCVTLLSHNGKYFLRQAGQSYRPQRYSRMLCCTTPSLNNRWFGDGATRDPLQVTVRIRLLIEDDTRFFALSSILLRRNGKHTCKVPSIGYAGARVNSGWFSGRLQERIGEEE